MQKVKFWLKLLSSVLVGGVAILFTVVAIFWGSYGVHTLIRNGGFYWFPVPVDSPRLTASIRLALASAPTVTPGTFVWQTISPGFEVADLPALVDGREVDHILLARIDPVHFRFVVRNASLGDKDLGQWMTQLGAALVVNGSYFSRYGEPDTPFLSEGVLLGPKKYDAKAGAFAASSSSAGIHNLAKEDWRTAFQGADNAMVSYPLLVRNGVRGVTHSSNWLANRSFVAQDQTGHILIGTTTDAFFSLERLARFLIDSPLGLTNALNLDGGPVACQGIHLNGYERTSYGRWEIEIQGKQAQLLHWSYGTTAMPIVLAVFPK